MENNVIVSKHARERIKERCGVGKKSAESRRRQAVTRTPVETPERISRVRAENAAVREAPGHSNTVSRRNASVASNVVANSAEATANRLETFRRIRPLPTNRRRAKTFDAA